MARAPASRLRGVARHRRVAGIIAARIAQPPAPDAGLPAPPAGAVYLASGSDVLQVAGTPLITRL
jgi:hypothetical protein